MRHVILVLFWIPLTTAYVAYSKEFFSNILNNVTSSLTPKCHQQFQEFIANLSRKDTVWANQMIDSYSRVPMGLVTLNFEDMGDFSKCIEINAKYCLGYVSFSNETSLMVPETVDFVAPVWSICLPNRCSTEDANVLGNVILTTLVDDGGIRVNFSDLLCQTRKEVYSDFTCQAIIAFVFLALLIMVVILSTIYDAYCSFFRTRCSSIIKAFSSYTNSKNVFKMTPSKSSHLPCLDGLKFISMIWVVIIHQYAVPMSGSTTNNNEMMHWPEKIHSMFILSGDISVDTFLTIGGTLMSYGFMKARHNNVSFNLLHYYFHRYLRLTASLVIVVLGSSTFLTYMGSGPKWPLFTVYFQKNCEVNWWATLLYVQNYMNPQKMCVGQTWYLDVDMQLYIISPFLFYLLWKYWKWGVLVLTLGILASMGSAFYQVWVRKLPGITFSLYSARSGEFQTYYYLPTHTRASTWIVGVILGYVIYKIQQGATFRLHKYIVLWLWFLCFGVLLACVLGGHTIFLNQEDDIVANAIYTALMRPAWALAIAWVVLACTNNYGGPVNWFLSLPIYQVLNRFMYSVYLTHVTLLYGIAYSTKWPRYFSEFEAVYQFWGTLWFSVCFAVLLVFIAETPAIAIENMLLGRSTKETRGQRNRDFEKGTVNISFET